MSLTDGVEGECLARRFDNNAEQAPYDPSEYVIYGGRGDVEHGHSISLTNPRLATLSNSCPGHCGLTIQQSDPLGCSGHSIPVECSQHFNTVDIHVPSQLSEPHLCQPITGPLCHSFAHEPNACSQQNVCLPSDVCQPITECVPAEVCAPSGIICLPSLEPLSPHCRPLSPHYQPLSPHCQSFSPHYQSLSPHYQSPHSQSGSAAGHHLLSSDNISVPFICNAQNICNPQYIQCHDASTIGPGIPPLIDDLNPPEQSIQFSYTDEKHKKSVQINENTSVRITEFQPKDDSDFGEEEISNEFSTKDSDHPVRSAAGSSKIDLAIDTVPPPPPFIPPAIELNDESSIPVPPLLPTPTAHLRVPDGKSDGELFVHSEHVLQDNYIPQPVYEKHEIFPPCSEKSRNRLSGIYGSPGHIHNQQDSTPFQNLPQTGFGMPNDVSPYGRISPTGKSGNRSIRVNKSYKKHYRKTPIDSECCYHDRYVEPHSGDQMCRVHTSIQPHPVPKRRSSSHRTTSPQRYRVFADDSDNDESPSDDASAIDHISFHMNQFLNNAFACYGPQKNCMAPRKYRLHHPVVHCPGNPKENSENPALNKSSNYITPQSSDLYVGKKFEASNVSKSAMSLVKGQSYTDNGDVTENKPNQKHVMDTNCLANRAADLMIKAFRKNDKSIDDMFTKPRKKECTTLRNLLINKVKKAWKFASSPDKSAPVPARTSSEHEAVDPENNPKPVNKPSRTHRRSQEDRRSKSRRKREKFSRSFKRSFKAANCQRPADRNIGNGDISDESDTDEHRPLLTETKSKQNEPMVKTVARKLTSNTKEVTFPKTKDTSRPNTKDVASFKMKEVPFPNWKNVTPSKVNDVSFSKSKDATSSKTKDATFSKTKGVSSSKKKDVTSSIAKDATYSKAKDVTYSKAKDVILSKRKDVTFCNTKDVSSVIPTKAKDGASGKPKDTKDVTECVKHGDYLHMSISSGNRRLFTNTNREQE